MAKKKNNKDNKKNKGSSNKKYIPKNDKYNLKNTEDSVNKKIENDKNIEKHNNKNKVDTSTEKKSEKPLESSTKNVNDTKTHVNDKKIKNIIVLGSAAILLVGSASLVYLNTSKYDDLSYNGIYIDSEHVGKLDKAELTKKISALLEEKLTKTTINIIDDKDTVSVIPEKIGVSYDIEKIITDIVNYKKKDNKLLNTISRISLNLKNHSIEYKPSIDDNTIETFITSIEKKFNVKPKNADVTFNGNKISATNESIGYKVDTEKLKQDLLKCINSNFTENTSITLSYIEVEPKLTKDMAEKLHVLGTFKTKLPSKTGDRTGNIKLFTSKLNKSVLLPGEEFSCDKAGGDRTWAEGYRNAHGYIDGEVVPILAGGICQATSTIYNALLYADLEITERHPHSMPVTYAKLGLDAAIAKGVKDLRFKNNTDNPIILQTYVSNDGYVVASIWGIPTVENKKIELFTKQFSSKSADAYRKVYIDGKLITTEKISSNRYR